MSHFIFSLLVLLAISLPASANNDLSTTINLAGKQRMLTQKMAKEALLVALHHNKADNLANLKKTSMLFNKTLKGLKKGDSDLGLKRVNSQKIQTQLDTIEGLWANYHTAVKGVVNGGAASFRQIDIIDSLNLLVLKEMNRAVQSYENIASSGANNNSNPAYAKAINIAGRQRMLTQKMSKDFFLMAMVKNLEESKQSLKTTMSLFETSLNTLIKGDKKLGLPVAPTPQILKQLQKVKSMWENFKPFIQDEPISENIKIVAEKNMPLLKEMNKAVGMYADYTKNLIKKRKTSLKNYNDRPIHVPSIPESIDTSVEG